MWPNWLNRIEHQTSNLGVAGSSPALGVVVGVPSPYDGLFIGMCWGSDPIRRFVYWYVLGFRPYTTVCLSEDDMAFYNR
jgi:hypothetical protein